MLGDKTFIIHIGMMKTASTYFQNYIFNQFEDIYYTGLWNIERNPINNFIEKILYTNIANIDSRSERKKIEDYISSIKEKKILIDTFYTFLPKIYNHIINQPCCSEKYSKSNY